MKEWRINRFLASAGLGSRRKVEDLIREGKISVNGTVETNLARTIQLGIDKVSFGGKPVFLLHSPDSPSSGETIAFHKPIGYLCSHSDPHAEKTIFSLLPKSFAMAKIAGRLDLDSRGLVILSFSGDLVQKVSHPSFQLEKGYLVQLEHPITDFDSLRTQFLQGITDQGEVLKALKLEKDPNSTKLFRITLGSGKKRHIRRMFQSLGHKVVDLYRFRIGNLTLGKLDLPEGKMQKITEEMIFGKPSKKTGNKPKRKSF